MTEGFFAGNFDDLRKHWENAERAEKFKSGGTRTKAIQLVMKRLNVDIHQNSWLDTGTGAGFVQTQVDPDVSPTLFVGMDFSKAMIQSQKDPYGILVIGSTFKLPFRKEAFTVVSNFFSLSDYPEPKDAFLEFSRTLARTGNLYFIDYAKGDDYWEERKRHHGAFGSDGKMIVGDINLRDIEDGKKLLDPLIKSIYSEILSLKIESEHLSSTFPIPAIITRKFLFIHGYKSRIKS